MEQAVKQRLVGAAVLTALAVITLPMVFDTERAPGVQVRETIPPAPTYPEVAITEPKPVALPPDRPAAEPVPVADMYKMDNEQAPAAEDEAADQAAAVEPAPAPQPPVAPQVSSMAKTPVAAKPSNATKTASAPPAATLPALPAAPGGKLDASGIPESWVVQVIATSDPKKADSLIAELKLNGYPAFSRVTHDAKGDMVKVLVGPKLDKAQATRMKQKLDREMGMQTTVKPFSAK